ERTPEADDRSRTRWLELRRPRELACGAHGIAVEERDAELEMGEPVVGRHGDRAGEERDAVVPVANLPVRRNAQRDAAETCNRDRTAARDARAKHGIDREDERDAEADARQVREAIGHALEADLHETADRGQRDDEPREADGDPWCAVP